MECITDELGIPKKYLKLTNKENRFIAIVHKSWLKSLIKYSKLTGFIETSSRLESWPTVDELGPSWENIFITHFKKRDVKVIPLPRLRGLNVEGSPLLFSQLMQYISQTNYRNLCKDAHRKYSNNAISNKEKQITLVDYNEVLREIIVRIYGCPIINTCDPTMNTSVSSQFDVHLNILPVVCCVETLNSMFLYHIPFVAHNLNDCVTFSPAILDKCYTKPLFIVYQLLQSLRTLHERSLTLGDITLKDIYLNEDLWIYIFPQIKSNLCVEQPEETNFMKKAPVHDCKKNGHKFGFNLKCDHCGIKTYDKVQIGGESLEKLCALWIDGQISNFTYITALNNMSGRKIGEPNCHHVFPWVTDFSSRCGKNWRDLKKSKFRLNKGDPQLDLTYANSQLQVPHHVSDVLSSITYYVYMARRTPKSVLCKNVRTVWVPAEYPSSIQRMQEWTPDECIPEFFADPGVFRSIHNDLEDLEVPAWCSGPEDFIEKHREALESQRVSDRLHHWIDLTFGFKLSGHAAVKSKNVCLHLVDEHKNLTKSGVVQLFSHPHPPRISVAQLYGNLVLKPTSTKTRQRSRDRSYSSVCIGDICRTDEEETLDDLNSTSFGKSPLGLTRFLSRSRSSLNEEQNSKPSSSPSRSASVGPKTSTFTSHVNHKLKNHLSVPVSPFDTIYLPKEYKPEIALEALEKKNAFFTKTFHPECAKLNLPLENSYEEFPIEETSVQNAFTNFIFSENFEASAEKYITTKSYSFPLDNHNFLLKQRLPMTKKNNNQIYCNYSDIISNKRVRELQIVGCLIVEIFLSKHLYALGANKSKLSFNERLISCLTVLRSYKYDLPAGVKYIVELLLQPEVTDYRKFNYPAVTDAGLPPPGAHLLLEPLLHSQVPFSPHFPKLYVLLTSLKDFENIASELDILYHFDCDGTFCAEYESLELTKILFAQNISECKVKSCAKNLDSLLDEVNTTTDVEVVDILLPHIEKLIENPPTSVLAAWYLLDPLSRAMGPSKTAETLLESILKLYENEPNEVTLPYYGKIAKLYHHSFLLRLIVRLGLKCFLDNFVAPLVEAIGGYKDYEKVDFILHTHREKITKKTSHLKTMDAEQVESSPSNDSSFASDRRSPPVTVKEAQQSQPEPELFEFEEEKQNEEQLKSLIEQLELNVASDLPFNHSTAEEALDATLVENMEHLATLEELNINVNEEYEGSSAVSPTIVIPSRKNSEFRNISCEIGSKKSENDSPFDKKFADTFDSPVSNADSRRNVSASASTASGSRYTGKSKQPETKISDMSADSLVWLSHRLGPVLTARYLSRNLLKMLTLCYVGRENLMSVSKEDISESNTISITSCYVLGDQNAFKVLECLGSIAGLYGEQFILFQYIPHMSELIALCKRKLTPNLEGGLISCLVLLKHIIPYISDATLMDQLQDVILKNIVHPCVRLLGSTKYAFPSGYLARNILAKKYLDTLYILSIRMGSDMTKTHLAVPSLQRFFMIFDKVNGSEACNHAESTNKIANETEKEINLTQSMKESHFIEVLRDGSTREWAISGGCPTQISHVRLKDSESVDSLSPPIPLHALQGEESPYHQALEELQAVFTSELAYRCYMPFLKHVGVSALEISLKNHHTIKDLCQEFQQELKDSCLNCSTTFQDVDQVPTPLVKSGSIGSNVALVGNRIDVQHETFDNLKVDLLSLVSNKMENTNRHLRGNWLAYWGHEIGRSDKDIQFNFKQIKLQSFTGHTHSVKCIYVLDNENSFMSGSRDKTVKLWSLRSQGDGTSTSNCQWTYAAHKKSVLSLSFVESLRLVASCDSVVHIWDPFMGANVGHLESHKYAPVNTLKSMPAPSSLIFAATTDGTLKIIDARLCSYIYELKVNSNPTGLIRCIAISPSGFWIAAGQSSGFITVLDSRTGLIISNWRAHEGEVLQLVAADNNTLISSSLDQTIGVWNVTDGKFRFHMRGSSEPFHCLNIYNSELISGSTANRIGVHTSIDMDTCFSSTKLRSDAFKGLLTSMALLPLNRLLLLGSDTGNINLLC